MTRKVENTPTHHRRELNVLETIKGLISCEVQVQVQASSMLWSCLGHF